MPSQEEYLDNLLKGLNESDDMNEQEAEAAAIDFADAEIKEFANSGGVIGVNDTIRLSEEDIERLLSEQEQPIEEEPPEEEQDEDLMDLLNGEDDSNLQDIQELLQKADNNEAVSEDIVSLLQDIPDENTNLMDAIMQEESQTEELLLDEKARRLEERKSRREARKAEKRALKEAKKAAVKEAKKAAVKEAKAEKKAKFRKVETESEEETSAEEISKSSEEEAEQISDGMDLSGLDALFAGLEREAAGSQPMDTMEEPVVKENFSEKVTTDSLVEKLVEDKRPKRRAFGKLLDLLTEEVEEEETPILNNENIPLSDENKNIIEELDKEKKKKGKKGKKDKDNNENNENKSNKPKTGKKPKKEKASKAEAADNSLQKGKRLTFRQVLPILLRCLSVAVIIILAANIAADYSAKKAAKEAYYNGDYEICYQYLFGKDRNESEQIMYSKSECILRIRMWIREYEMLAEEGSEPEALDSLIQSVHNYPVLYEYAVQWNAGADMAEAYAQILGILSEKYHLTEAQAMEIADTRSDVDYSKMIYSIADGGAFGSWDAKKPKEATENPEALEDLLQEEADLEDIPFVDNN